MNASTPTLFASARSRRPVLPLPGILGWGVLVGYLALATVAVSMSQAVRRPQESKAPSVSLLSAVKLPARIAAPAAAPQVPAVQPAPVPASAVKSEPVRQRKHVSKPRRERVPVKPSPQSAKVAAPKAPEQTKAPDSDREPAEPAPGPAGPSPAPAQGAGESPAAKSPAVAAATAGTSNAGSGIKSSVAGPRVRPKPTRRLEVLPFTDGMARPKLLSQVAPVYSAQARAARVSGLVLAKCVITTAGRLNNCRIIKGHPLMNKSVLKALSRWKYSPVRYQGAPVNVDYVIRLRLVPP